MSKPVRHGDKWRIRWIDHDDCRQSATFASFKEAEAALIEKKSKTNRIRLGLEEPTPMDLTFDQLCDKYLANCSSQKRRARDDESIVRIHLRPTFGKLKLKQIQSDLVEEYKAGKTHLHPNTIHHHLTLLIAMLRYAFDSKWLRALPKIKKPKIVLIDKNFRYLKTEDEISRFLHAAQSIEKRVFVLYATAIYTGLREGELAALTWDDINFENRQITISKSFAGPTKNNETRHVPIFDVVLPILREWRLQQPSKYVFPSATGIMLCPSARIFKDTFHRTVIKAGFSKIQLQGKVRWYVNFHGLRHTFASLWMKRGGDIFKLQKLLGHKDITMTQRYAHLAPDAFLGEYARFGGPVNTAPNKVIVL
jgi:integrase